METWESGQLVVDREGRVWEVCRDGGMAQRAKWQGMNGVESIGIEYLANHHGPLRPFDGKAWYEAQANSCPACGGTGMYYPGMDLDDIACPRGCEPPGAEKTRPATIMEDPHGGVVTVSQGQLDSLPDEAPRLREKVRARRDEPTSVVTGHEGWTDDLGMC